MKKSCKKQPKKAAKKGYKPKKKNVLKQVKKLDSKTKKQKKQPKKAAKKNYKDKKSKKAKKPTALKLDKKYSRLFMDAPIPLLARTGTGSAKASGTASLGSSSDSAKNNNSSISLFNSFLDLKERREQREHELKLAHEKYNTSYTYHENKHNFAHNINDQNINDYAAIERARNDRVVIDNDIKKQNQINDLLNKGAISYKDGKLHTNERIYNYYLKQILMNRNSEAQKAREEYIEQEAVRRSEEYANNRAIQIYPGLINLFKRKVTREVNKKERKELKRLYKLNGKRLKFEKKYGKLIDDNLI